MTSLDSGIVANYPLISGPRDISLEERTTFGMVFEDLALRYLISPVRVDMCCENEVQSFRIDGWVFGAFQSRG